MPAPNKGIANSWAGRWSNRQQIINQHHPGLTEFC